MITIYNEKENPGRDFLISFRQFFFSRNCTRSSVSKGSHPRWKSFPSINASSWWTSTVAVGSQRNFSQVHSLLKIAHDSKLILGYVALTDNFVSCLYLHFFFCLDIEALRHLNLARNAWWHFCQLVETMIRFASIIRLNFKRLHQQFSGLKNCSVFTWNEAEAAQQYSHNSGLERKVGESLLSFYWLFPKFISLSWNWSSVRDGGRSAEALNYFEQFLLMTRHM